MKKYINTFLIIVFAAFLIFLWECSKDKFDKHYNATSGQNVQLKNVLSGLREKGYNEFASAMDKSNLDSAFSSGMSFTVFAVPDEIFKQAAGNLTGYNLKFFVLNHILAGKFYSASFKNIQYRALGGCILNITTDSVSNFNKEWVRFTGKRDIDIPDGLIIELSNCINVLPDFYHDFSTYYPFSYSFFKNDFIPNPVSYPQRVGVNSTGLFIDSVSKIFDLTGKSNYFTFQISSEDYIKNAYNAQLTQLLPYFIGADTVIKNDLAFHIRNERTILSTSFNSNKDTITVNNIVPNTYRFPVSKVKQLGFDNGNRLLVIDTLMYHYPVRTSKVLNFLTAPVTIFTGAFGGIDGSGNITWNSPPKIGDYVEFSFSKDSIYSKNYKIYLYYNYKPTYVAVKIYLDGDSIGRFDLGAQSLIHAGSIYEYNLTPNLLMKYQQHTVRFEITGVKPGNKSVIMNILQLGLTLNN